MNPQLKTPIQNRLARIEGQVRGLMHMVQEDRECIDVLTQVAALRSALEAFGSLVLSEHIEQLVGEAGLHDDQIEHLRLALERFLK
jgi:DNA-binding FrmR family transcriptional regulator